MAYATPEAARAYERTYRRQVRQPKLTRERAAVRASLLKPCAWCRGPVCDSGKGPVPVFCSRKCSKRWWDNVRRGR